MDPLDSAPAPANVVMEEVCSFELTRSNSDVASSLTAENSGDISHPSANARPGKCVQWTDEKHNKYLDSLEASFVQRLNRSTGFLAWCREQNSSAKDSSHRTSACVSKVSEQFTVLQDGQWQKIIFEKDQPISYIPTAKIPWMHCQRRAGKNSCVSADPKECNELHCEEERFKEKRVLSSRSASISEQNHLNCYYNSAIEEGSGQNFDEDCQHDPNTISLAKRLKTSVDDTSSKDQIVPSRKFFA